MSEQMVTLEKKEMPDIQLVITIVPKIGGVNVAGPINDRFLCYGMLEMAKDAIVKHQEEASKSALVKANGRHRIMDFLRGGKQ